MAHWVDQIVNWDACDDGRTWADGTATLAEAWATCRRGDWMLWLMGRTRLPPLPVFETDAMATDHVARRHRFADCLVEIAGGLMNMKSFTGPARTIYGDALGTVRAWAKGGASDEQLRAIADVPAVINHDDNTPNTIAYQIIVELSNLAAFDNPDAGLRAQYCVDLGSAVATYVSQFLALQYDGPYLLAREAAASIIADIVRSHYPTPPALPEV